MNYIQNGLTPNIFEIALNKNEAKLLCIDYKDEIYDQLIESYNDYFFYRNADKIFAWELKETDEQLPLEFSFADVSIETHTLVMIKIIEMGFIELFRSHKYDIHKEKYSSNWFFKLSKEKPLEIGELFLSPFLYFSFNPLFSNREQKQVLSISLNVRNKPKFKINEDELKTLGIDSRDWDRNHNSEIVASKKNIYKYLRAQNLVQRYEDVFNKINSDIHSYKSISKFLTAFKDLRKYKLSETAIGSILKLDKDDPATIDQHSSLFKGITGWNNFIAYVQKNFNLNEEIIQSKFQNEIHVEELIKLPSQLKINDISLYKLPNSKFDVEQINKPQYYFYNKRTGNGYYNDRLVKLGPYSKDIFSNKQINIVLITPDIYQQTVENFKTSLQNYLVKLFHFRQIQIIISPFNLKQESYVNALAEIDFENINLAILVFSAKDKAIPITNSPYYLTKTKLLNQKIPSQDLLIEVIKRADEFIYNNIALNIYSKIGGTAWTVERDHKDDVAELIVGIGATSEKNSTKISGFANIFDYDGTYIVGDCSELCTMSDYVIKLEKHLEKLLRNAINLKGLSDKSIIRLIFHLYKEAGRDTEFKAINNAIKKFPSYTVEKAVVHLSYNHNYRLFSNEGKTRVHRGTYIQISTFQSLLHLGGSSRVPLLIRLDKRSDPKDIYDISKQILVFSHLSFRGFKPPNQPVTIQYPTLMARLANDLRKIPEWDPEMMNKLSDKLWFI